jgi:1-acyl-sn-glycerol-3-phosphate acyltransferase
MEIKRTVLEVPLLGPIVRGLCRFALVLMRWRPVGGPPGPKKCVIIAAPHTSNWDFIYAILVCYAMGTNVYWMGKKEMFPWPFKGLMMRFGGVPVDRENAYNVAKEAILAFRKAQELRLIIPPEATRKKVDDWKRGFYLIARGAKVPIVCGYIDYKHRTGGFGPVVIPSKDQDADMKVFRDFYMTITARYPENVGMPKIGEEKEGAPRDA